MNTFLRLLLWKTAPAVRLLASLHTLVVLFALLLPACRPDPDDGDLPDADAEESLDPVPPRRTTLVVDGCAIDATQGSSLRAEETRRVVSEVVLLCLSLTDRGAVTLRGGHAQAALKSLIADLRGLGYATTLGITAVDADDDEQPADELAGWLGRAGWRTASVQALVPYAMQSDGLQLMLPDLTNAARADLTRWVTALAARLHPQYRLGLFVPPSVRQPSDVEGGDAYDLSALAAQVDRVRILSLDAASGDAPGSSIDADWTLQTAALALKYVPADKLDVSLSLHGVDFRLQPGPTRTITEETAVTFAEAQALVTQHAATPQGGDGDALHFTYRDSSNNDHEVWYEDSASVLQALRDLPTATLPATVGVVLFSLGDEDPDLWSDLDEALPVDAR